MTRSPNSPMKRPCHSRGYALVLVLWVLVLLTTIGIGFSYAVKVESHTGSALADRVRTEAIADAGIRRALLGLQAKAKGDRWKSDGRIYEIPWPDATLRITMRAENGKIDLNAAPRELLAGLFSSQLSDVDGEALADAVIDWRDRDDRRSPNGAEAGDYRAAGRGYEPANSRFNSVAELSQVMGFDGESMQKVKPISPCTRERINALSADEAVLAAIPNVGPDLAAQFVAGREQALDLGDKVDTGLLAGASRYLENRPAQHGKHPFRGTDRGRPPGGGQRGAAHPHTRPLRGTGVAQRYPRGEERLMKPAEFFHWWRGELAGLIPARARNRVITRQNLLQLLIEGDGVTIDAEIEGETHGFGKLAPDHADEESLDRLESFLGSLTKKPEQVVVRLAMSQFIQRELTLPLASQENLNETIGFQMDRSPSSTPTRYSTSAASGNAIPPRRNSRPGWW